MFDPVTYIETLKNELKLTRTDYLFARVSNLNELEEVLENAKRNGKFIAIEDSQDGFTFRGAAGGFFERRQYTVYILARTKYGDMDARASAIDEARTIFRHYLSRMIFDKLSIEVIDLERLGFYEVPPTFAQGVSGIYFMFTVQNPVSLLYDSTAWEN